MAAAVAAGDLWAFSLELYHRPGVAEACLSLQDRCSVNVNLLLHALWCGARGHRVTQEERQQLDQAVATWHEQVVEPLRGTRRWMKAQATMRDHAAMALREAIKKQELEAERLEQLLLERTLAPLPGASALDHAAANALDLLPSAGPQESAELLLILETLWPNLDKARLEEAFGHRQPTR